MRELAIIIRASLIVSLAVSFRPPPNAKRISANVNHREKAFLSLAKEELYTTFSCRNLVLNAKTKSKVSSDPIKEKQKTVSKEGKVDVRNLPFYDRFQDFLYSEIGLEDSQKVQNIAQRSPSLVGYTEPRLNQTFNLLRDLFQLSDLDLQGLMIKESKIFVISTELLESKIVKFSEMIVDGNPAAAKVILTKQPSILTVDIENNLLPKVEYLGERVFKSNKTALVEVLLNCPVLLAMSLNARLIPRAEALLMCGYDPSRAIQSWCLLNPNKFRQWFEWKTMEALPKDLFPAEAEQTQERYTFDERIQSIVQLLSTKLDMDHGQAIRLLEKCPTIQPYSVNIVQKKLSYLLDLFDGSKEDVRSQILTSPQIFACSLEKLKVAVALLRQKWFPDDEEDVIFLSSLRKWLPYIAKASRERIEQRVEAVCSAGLDRSKLKSNFFCVTNEDFEMWLAKQEKAQR